MEFAPGEKLPTERALAENYNVGRTIIRHAIDDLVEKGTLIRFRGRGTFLNPRLSDEDIKSAKEKPLGFLFIGGDRGKINYLNEEIILSLSRFLSEKDSHLVSMSIAKDFDGSLEKIPRPIREGLVEGVFVRGDLSPDIINAISEMTPVMQVGNYIRDVNASAIIPDNMGGIRQAFEHLYNLGHRRIGYLGGPSFHTAYWERAQGYKQALEMHNMAFNEEVAFISDTYDYDLEKIKNIVKKVSAVICDTDNKAANVIYLLKELGSSVPEDLSVTGFDNTAKAEITSPTITSVSFDRNDLAEQAILNLKNTRKSKTKILLPTKLIIRNSTCAPR